MSRRSQRMIACRTLRILVCGFFLLAFAAPSLLAASSDASAGAQMSAAGPTTAQQKQQAMRRKEIHQKKIDNPEAEDAADVYRHSPMVHSLAKMFGLSVESTSRLFETINFVLLVIAIVWGIAKLLPRALRSRTERIRNEIEQARVATAEANRRLAGVEERLAHLDSEIEAIRARAEQETLLEEKHLRAALEQEKQSIVESATQDIQAASKNAQSQLKKLAADLIIEHARRQIAVTPETDRSLIDGFLGKLNEKQPPNGGVN